MVESLICKLSITSMLEHLANNYARRLNISFKKARNIAIDHFVICLCLSTNFFNFYNKIFDLSYNKSKHKKVITIILILLLFYIFESRIKKPKNFQNF